MKTQSSAQKKPKKTYRTYLLRCWPFSTAETGQKSTQRFVLETLSNPLRRWVFDSLAALNDFLQTEIVEG
jgi:hypothetical protein